MKRLLPLLLALASCAPCFAAREFDGTNDQISFGSDASVDTFDPRVYEMWVRLDATGATSYLAGKGSGSTEMVVAGTTNALRTVSDWTTDGNWVGTTTIADGAWHFIAVTYSHSATTNDPTLTVDGTSGDVLVTDTAPTGSWTADAGNNLLLGTTSANALDLDGAIAFFVYHSGILNAAAINRDRWWGRGRGDHSVYHSFLTTKLANEGSATADGTASGTTVAGAAIPVQRPGYTLMNGGVGW